jgi:hypothetical protein
MKEMMMTTYLAWNQEMNENIDLSFSQQLSLYCQRKHKTSSQNITHLRFKTFHLFFYLILRFHLINDIF